MFSFYLQRVGLHPRLKRQGGGRRLALGIEGKLIVIIILPVNIHTKANEEFVLQGLMGRPVTDLGVKEVSGGGAHGPASDLDPDMVATGQGGLKAVEHTHTATSAAVQLLVLKH